MILNNECAVKEVIDFCKGSKFLFGLSCPGHLSVKIVNKIPHDFMHAGPDAKPYWNIQDGELTFSEIKSDEMIVAINELDQDETKKNLSGHARRILMGKAGMLSIITKILPKEYIKEACDEIILEDLLCCAQWRAVFGVKDSFWETAFQIYKSGGMPDGWSGHYPEGRFMAIYPGLKSQM